MLFLKTFPPPLSAEEERVYLQKYIEGDLEAKHILIERNLRLVAHVIKKYQHLDEDMEDLISIGTIGLIKAIVTFNPDKNNRLGTYAARCIENEILMMLRSKKKTSKEISLYEPIGTDREGNEIQLYDIIETDDDDAHREEAEESKRLITALGQYFIDNQVGRRTDEGEHSAQTSGKGERHEETRRLHARARSYAHDDRHHEGHRSGIAHEGADKRGNEHYEQEGDGFVAARERHELIARKLGKSGLHDSSTHHEEAYHHDDDGRREAGKSLCRRQDSENQECCQGSKSHNISPHPAPYKYGNRND